MSPSADIRCVVLDFDGTFTDVDREAVPFLAAYRDGLAARLGGPIDAPWDEALAVVRSDPDAHGFEFEGTIVAPSHADPYILAASVARIVLSGGVGSKLDGPERDDVLNALFRKAYAESATVFRPDAREVLDALLAGPRPVYVVSNSHTEHVRTKLSALRDDALEHVTVHGNAKKFHLVAPDPSDAAFGAVPETRTVEGLARPVHLRRGRYYELLRGLFAAAEVTPREVLVCGDIFELDLALPAALGARTHLVTRESTPAYERAAVEASGGTWSANLAGVLDVL